MIYDLFAGGNAAAMVTKIYLMQLIADFTQYTQYFCSVFIHFVVH